MRKGPGKKTFCFLDFANQITNQICFAKNELDFFGYLPSLKASPTNKTGFFGLHLIFRTPCSFHGYQVLGHALQHLLMWKIHYCNQIRGIIQGEFLNNVETILASLRSVPCHCDPVREAPKVRWSPDGDRWLKFI